MGDELALGGRSLWSRSDAFQALCVEASLQVISVLSVRGPYCAARDPAGVLPMTAAALRWQDRPPASCARGQRGAPEFAGATLRRCVLELPTFAWASDTDVQTGGAAAVAAGVSTYATRVCSPVCHKP
jgi:hypothetical protein